MSTTIYNTYIDIRHTIEIYNIYSIDKKKDTVCSKSSGESYLNE